MKERRWILPLAQLMLCAQLLWPFRGFLLFRIQSAAHAHRPTKIDEPAPRLGPVQVPDTPMPDIQVPAMRREMRRKTLVDLRLWAPAVLNFPSGFLGLARRSGVPQGMLPEFWRSISWPFVGIFFGGSPDEGLRRWWHLVGVSCRPRSHGLRYS
jgi:hypothetical protein